MDVRLVKDVLSLSSIAEVKGDCVRMGGGQWQQFVLPDAPTSTVELMNAQHGSSERRVEGDGDSAEVEGEGEDEDEDDIVFVMGRDAVPVDSWTAGRRQT
jgi:la-related protein 1